MSANRKVYTFRAKTNGIYKKITDFCDIEFTNNNVYSIQIIGHVKLTYSNTLPADNEGYTIGFSKPFTYNKEPDEDLYFKTGSHEVIITIAVLPGISYGRTSNNSGGTVVIETLVIDPSTSEQTFPVGGNIDGYGPITVNPVTSSIDENISSGNIKAGVEILGVTGDYEGTPKFEVTLDNFIGDIDSNGVLEPPAAISGMTFTGVTKTTSTLVNEEHIPALSLSNSNIAGTISFPDLTTIEAYSLYTSFRDNNITSVSMPNLTTVGDYGMYQCFYSTYQNTRTISGTIDLSNLTTIGDYGMSGAFSNQPEITGVSLANLTTVGYYGMSSAFTYCTGLTDVDLSSLTTIDTSGLSNTFYNSKLTNITFDNLSSIGANGLQSAFFMNSTLQSISFPALTPNSFASGDTSAFSRMLTVVSNATVHFPVDLRSVIGSWPDVLNGFGGTNTTVLFDLDGCTTTFDIIPSRYSIVMVNSELISDEYTALLRKGTTVDYIVYNQDYGFYTNSYNVPSADTDTLSVDLRGKTYNTVAFNIGISGLTILCQIEGFSHICRETSSGVYTLLICNETGHNVDIEYYIDGGNSYADESNVLAFSTGDVSLNITLTPATSIDFVNPVLSSNGTLGGNAFAVATSNNNWSAYQAFDNNASTAANIYSSSSAPTMWFEFYNPTAIKPSNIRFRFGSGSYETKPDSITIEASNDGTNWENVANWSGTAGTIVDCNISYPKAYKYYRSIFTSSDTGISIYEITITAIYKE